MPYRWKQVALLFCCAALNYGCRAATASVFPLFRSDLGLTDFGMAAVGSLFLWSYALESSFAGWLADRVSRSRVIVASLTGWSLVTLATGFATSVDQLLATRVLLGIAECLYLPAAIALIADHHRAETRATAIGIHTAGLSIGLVAGGWASGYLGAHFGWPAQFRVLGLCGLGLACGARFWLLDGAVPITGKRFAWRQISTLLRTCTFMIVILEAMVVALGNNAFINWLPLYFKETYAMSLAGAAFRELFCSSFPPFSEPLWAAWRRIVRHGAKVGADCSCRVAAMARRRHCCFVFPPILR
jgi:MFS family permease